MLDGKEVDARPSCLRRLGFSSADLNEPVRDLSGGQKRRLALMLILLDEPNVLVLDEPGNDLDTDMLAVVEDLLDALAGHAAAGDATTATSWNASPTTSSRSWTASCASAGRRGGIPEADGRTGNGDPSRRSQADAQSLRQSCSHEASTGTAPRLKGCGAAKRSKASPRRGNSRGAHLPSIACRPEPSRCPPPRPWRPMAFVRAFPAASSARCGSSCSPTSARIETLNVKVDDVRAQMAMANPTDFAALGDFQAPDQRSPIPNRRPGRRMDGSGRKAGGVGHHRLGSSAVGRARRLPSAL